MLLNWLAAGLYSAWTGWSWMQRSLKDFLLSRFWAFLRVVSSFVHHHCLNKLGHLSFRWSSSVSLVICTTSSTSIRNSSLVLIWTVGDISSNLWARSAFTLGQSACLKSNTWTSGALGSGRDNSITIGRWSAIGGCIAGTTSHLEIRSSGVLLRHTLSGLVQLPVAVWKVWRPLGSASSISFL